MDKLSKLNTKKCTRFFILVFAYIGFNLVGSLQAQEIRPTYLSCKGTYRFFSIPPAEKITFAVTIWPDYIAADTTIKDIKIVEITDTMLTAFGTEPSRNQDSQFVYKLKISRITGELVYEKFMSNIDFGVPGFVFSGVDYNLTISINAKCEPAEKMF